MRFIFIRHAQTPANVRGTLHTAHPGPGLTRLGRQQAKSLPSALAGEAIHGLYVSTMRRTQITARPLAKSTGLDPVIEDGLYEIPAGALEGLRDRASVMSYLDTMRRWGRGELDARIPGSEDGHHFFSRFGAALDRIAQRHDQDASVAVFSHGAAIRVWCGGATTNVDPEYAAKNYLENTGIVIVNGTREDGYLVETWQGKPVGGWELQDPTAVDPTGESY